jgi:hypothetical protein
MLNPQATNLFTSEGSGFITVNVVRTGDLSNAASVDYATTDGTASERTDYTTALGTLRFAPGEASKSFTVLLADDALQEGNETINVTLSDASGALLLPPDKSLITIQDDDFLLPPGNPNPSDDPQFFVRRHFIKDTQELGGGIIVGQGLWEQQLEANKQAFVGQFVARPEFVAAYPATLSAAQYVDALNSRTAARCNRRRAARSRRKSATNSSQTSSPAPRPAPTCCARWPRTGSFNSGRSTRRSSTCSTSAISAAAPATRPTRTSPAITSGSRSSTASAATSCRPRWSRRLSSRSSIANASVSNAPLRSGPYRTREVLKSRGVRTPPTGIRFPRLYCRLLENAALEPPGPPRRVTVCCDGAGAGATIRLSATSTTTGLSAPDRAEPWRALASNKDE